MPARATRRATRLAVGVALLPAASLCWAQASAPLRLKASTEIAPFRLVAVEGYIQASTLSDGSSSVSSTGGAPVQARQTSLTEEIYVMTHSYVYHPSLLLLDLGGGPVIDKYKSSTSTSDGSEDVWTNSGQRRFNLNARATFLRDKPYTGALFYDRGSQTQVVGPAQQMLTVNTNYGATFSLLRPVTSMPLKIDLTRSTSQGVGAEQLIDDHIDQLHFETETTLGKLGSTKLIVLDTRQGSASGSSGLPIQASNSASDRVNLDTRLQLGARSEYDVNNSITLYRNSYTSGEGPLANQKEFSFDLDLRGRHSDDLQSYARYQLSANRQDDQAMNVNSANADLTYAFTPELSGTLAARAAMVSGTQLSSTALALDGSAQYRKTLPLGQANVSYSGAFGKYDQQSLETQVKMLGEHVTLVGTSFAPLSKPLIVASTVLVSNLTRSQTFVEGSDYVLSQLGLVLRVQRLVGGNIVDGQEVLVDYEYASGGTYASTRFDNTINLNWNYKSYLSLYARYLASSPQLESGLPTSPLNTVRSTLYGVRTDVPLPLAGQQIMLGGNAEREVRLETISPYERVYFEAYAQTDLPLFRSGNIRVGARKLQVVYDDSPLQGVNLSAADLRLSARIASGMDLSVEASRYSDTGSSELRSGSLATMKARWRLRKLLLTFDLNRSLDIQGLAERKRTYAQLLLRRDY